MRCKKFWLSGLLVLFLSFSVIAQIPSPQKILAVELAVQQDRIDLLNAYTLAGTAANYSAFGNDTVELVSFEGKKLFSFKMDLFPSTGLETSTLLEPAIKTHLILPFFKNTQKIVFLNSVGKRFEINVAAFAQTCGNATCEPAENEVSCPTDCVSAPNDNYCNPIADFKCDLDCKKNVKDPDCGVSLSEQQLISNRFYNAGYKIAFPTTGQYLVDKINLNEIWFFGVVVIIGLALIWFGKKIQEDRAN